MTLTKAALLEKGKARLEKVDVPEIGDVWLTSVSELRQSERDSVFMQKNTDDATFRAYAIIDQVCEESGDRMFCEDDLESIKNMDKKVTRALFKAIKAFNGESAKNEPESGST